MADFQVLAWHLARDPMGMGNCARHHDHESIRHATYLYASVKGAGISCNTTEAANRDDNYVPHVSHASYIDLALHMSGQSHRRQYHMPCTTR